jgi:cysteine desulfurase family protein (TIGR01976 family)
MQEISEIRAHFPALERRQGERPIAYFDAPGGTQVPLRVARAVMDYLLHHNANTHWNFPTSNETDRMLQSSRLAVADFLNCSAEEVVFGNNMTTLTFHLARALGRGWGGGGEVVVTDLDHQANVAPWRALAEELGMEVKAVPFDPATGELDWAEMERAITARTRLVAIGAASNALGTISPVREAARLAHRHGALCFVDAVHYAAHEVIDVREMECDFLACSPYKFYGPHAGVLFGRGEVLDNLNPAKVGPAPDDLPERFETGTQNHEGIVGTGAAIEFLASLGTGANRRGRLVDALQGLHARGSRLFERLWSGLNGIPGVRCYGPGPQRPRTPTVSFSIKGTTPAVVASNLAERAIFVSHGNFYATTVLERLGYGAEGLVRVGCACYTTAEEIERLISEIEEIACSCSASQC